MRKTNNSPRFWGDESGQAIVFGALTLFILVLAVVVVYNVGAVVAERMQLQQAADAAATAGAQIEANAISSIAWMISAIGLSRTGLVMIPAWQKRQPRVHPRMLSNGALL